MATVTHPKRPLACINDVFRITLVGGHVLFTDAVSALPAEKKAQLLRDVQAFDKFDENNDPFDEHDFGSVLLDGEEYFWKIDYYDLSLRYHSEDPTDVEKTKRVITILRADEY